MARKKESKFYKSGEYLVNLFSISGLTREQFAKNIPISRPTLRNWMENGVTYSNWEKISEVYGKLIYRLESGDLTDQQPTKENIEEKNIQEPIRSNASMYKPDVNLERMYAAMQSNALPSNITHIPQAAEAGMIGGTFDPIRDDEVVRWAIPGLYGNCYSFIVKGESMEATLAEGEILITKSDPITDINDVENDYIYAIVTKDNVLVKRVNRHSNDEYIWLVSDNDDYEMIEIHFSEIIAMYKGRRILKHQLDQKLRYE